MSRGTIATIAFLLAMSAGSSAVQEPPQSRAFNPTSATGSLSGVVVIEGPSATRQPARRTIVTLSGPGLQPSRGTITDDAGRFGFRNLPAGRFTLTAARTSFITSQYGAKRPGRPGTPVAVGGGEQIANLVVRLWPGAVISGVVRDERGDPVEGVAVTAVPERARRAAPTWTLTNNGDQTNERGEYRIFGLEPGRYVVAAEADTAGLGQIGAPTEAELDAAFEALRRRAAPATSTAVSSRTTTLPPETGPLFDYAPTYFPGTASVAAATPLTLEAGQEQSAVDFAIQRVPTATVSGTVVHPGGRPVAGVGVRMVSAAPSTFQLGGPRTLSATTRLDGTFAIGQITPGDYKIHVRAAATPVPETPGRVSIDTTVPLLWGLADITVSGSDVSGLTLNLQPALTVSGRLVFEPGAAPRPPDLTQLRINVTSTTQRPGGISILNGVAQGNVVMPVTVRADGSFDIGQLTPDTYQVSVTGAPLKGTSWALKSAIVGGRDVLDHLLTIVPGANITGAVFTMSDRATELSGRLVTSTGDPVADVFVMAFSADRSHWGGAWRRVQAVRPAADGRYVLQNLPSGDYLIAALVDVDENQWQDAAFLDQIAPASIKLTIGEGEKKTQDLRLGGG